MLRAHAYDLSPCRFGWCFIKLLVVDSGFKWLCNGINIACWKCSWLMKCIVDEGTGKY